MSTPAPPMEEAAEQFESLEQQHAAAELGMWVFLATELMFFGPLFLGYAYGRWALPESFAAASRHTDVVIGTANTAILLTSGLFMALALRAAKLSQQRATRVFLLITATLGAAFLALKGLEYHDEWREHLVPWLGFGFEPRYQRGAAMFYYLYFGMTGLHAVHLTIGIGVACALRYGCVPILPNGSADKSKSAPCTGTSSTASGSFFIRSSTWWSATDENRLGRENPRAGVAQPARTTGVDDRQLLSTSGYWQYLDQLCHRGHQARPHRSIFHAPARCRYSRPARCRRRPVIPFLSRFSELRGPSDPILPLGTLAGTR